MNRSLAISLILLALIAGFMGGYSFNPGYREMRAEQNMMELGVADRTLDKRYINGMIAHHLSAIDMAKQALEQSDREEVRTLSQAIITADEKGIAELMEWKKAWYNDSTKVTRFTQINLGTRDENFDLRFMNALIAHHVEAIKVNNEVQTKSSRNEVLTLASNVVSGLSASKEQLEAWRKEWYVAR